jgi:hypothetical protein
LEVVVLGEHSEELKKWVEEWEAHGEYKCNKGDESL